MKTYYQERVPVYDDVYQYLERQEDLQFPEQYIAKHYKYKIVLEVAAGTGCWAQFIASKAKAVMTLDVTLEALQQIKNRPNSELVSTLDWDAYLLDGLTGSYEGLFAGLWVSQVPLHYKVLKFL